MKSTLSILALAAGVVADGFRDAGSFSCPSNTNNQCNAQQQSGYDFGSAPLNQPGFSYGGMFFDKWTCESGGNSKRFDRRGGGRQITGSCSSDKDQCPSFGCESGGGIDSFSISVIEVFVEFDCDLEFHYSMPDGSDCKQRSPCSSKGSSISNTQCGGAKNVTVVYPSQSGKPKPSCSVTIPSVSFSCHSTTTQPGSHSTSSPVAHTTTTSSAAGQTTTSSTQAAQTTTTTTSSAQAVQTTTSSTTSSTAGQSSQQSTTPSSTPSSSPSVTTSISLSTSTVLTTITSTITSCAASVTNCPAESRSVTTTTVVIAVSTTVCPVTLTQTQSVAPTSTSSPAVVASSSMSSPQAVTTTTTSSSPVGTLPCPSVVPSCLNTWLFSLSCTDNTDTGCYCPNTVFVENIFSCIYAHGETDEIISEAVIFFQGLCAPYVGGNPGIATGAATVTTYLTVTPTPQAGATYTTITVEATTVVPCTNEAGSTIPSSSQTTTLTTTLAVPQVGFTTTAGSVGVVPVTVESTAPAAAAASTTLTTYAPAGSGSFTPTPSSSSPLVTVNAAGRVSTGFGLAGLAVMGLVAAL